MTSLALIASGLLFSTSASAGTTPALSEEFASFEVAHESPEAITPPGQDEYCWVQLQAQTGPVETQVEETWDTVKNKACAKTEEKLHEKIAKEFKKVLVKDKKEYDKKVVEARAAGTEALAAEYGIGILYWDANFSGSSTYFSTPDPTTCYGGTQYYNYSYLGYLANDKASSLRGLGGCQGLVWEHSGFSGLARGYYDCASYLGDLNDKVSSVTWHLTTRYWCF